MTSPVMLLLYSLIHALIAINVETPGIKAWTKVYDFKALKHIVCTIHVEEFFARKKNHAIVAKTLNVESSLLQQCHTSFNIYEHQWYKSSFKSLHLDCSQEVSSS